MKILLLHYYGGAGGKFIANCLSFSHCVALQNYKIALEILKDKTLLEKTLLATIPSKEKSKTWLAREHGCWQLFGNWINKHYDDKLDQVNDLTKLGDVWFPIMAHYGDLFAIRTKQFKDDDTVFKVLVDADPEFIDLAIRLKWPEQHHCLDLDDYRDWKNSIVRSNYDFIFDNWNPIKRDNHSQIVELAKHIGVDFDISMAKNYIDKYIDFHVD